MIRVRTVLLAAICLTGPGSARAADVSVLPFVWAPSLDGTLRFGDLQVPLHVSPIQLARGARAGAMLYGDRAAGQNLVFGQLLAAKFRDDRFEPLSGLQVGAELVSVEAGFGRSMKWHRFTVTPVLGGRYNHLAGSLTGGPESIKARRNWAELLLGTAAKYQITDRLDFQARYTVAALAPKQGRNEDIIAASSFALNSHIAIVGGYRWSRQHVERSKGNAFGFQLTAKGPIIGLRIN